MSRISKVHEQHFFELIYVTSKIVEPTPRYAYPPLDGNPPLENPRIINPPLNGYFKIPRPPP